MELRKRRALERKRYITLWLLCIFIPPLGIYVVWRNAYSLTRKSIMSAAATIVLSILFVHLFSVTQEPADLRPVARPAGAVQQQTDIYSPSLGQEFDPFAEPAPEDDFVAPSNPNA